MGKKLAAAILLAAVLIGGGLYLVRHSRQADNGIRVSGSVEATTVELSFKLPGQVLERSVDEGEAVKLGQVVARLEGADLSQELAARRADVAAQQAALSELQAGTRYEEIRQAEAALDRIRSEEVRARDNFARYKNLLQREVVPRSEYDVVKTSFEGASSATREAVERLRELRNGPRREAIDQARARLAAVEKSLALAQTRLGYTTLASPISGTVLAKHVEPGEQVSPGTPIISVADLSSVWIKAYIPETELGRVHLGQKAEVTTDTFPGKVYPGTVTFIASDAEFTPKTVQTEKERVKLVYRIKITVANPSRELKPGMPADALLLSR